MTDDSGAVGISLVFREGAATTARQRTGGPQPRFRRPISFRGDISGV
ncbi:hypothetical protein PM023_13295 [Halorubrum ezzemoulense]|nr:hypothetical protein [Halorubrum ezzemoulense]MDB2225645.1 hypothetical protein [Halorubrum ezzemoulense]MDB2241521.1 hypothetical protein [Halorubrum ezzemoulense]